MMKITPSICLAALLALGLQAAPAHADQTRTFVSAARGSDANGTNTDCFVISPCKTFKQAHDHTLANGEITVLDPGGYGAVTITKAISIINDGVGEAGVLVSGGATGITITAGTTDSVSLRGLTIKGIGFGGGAGIVFNSGKSLTAENCVIRNLTANGIQFFPNASSNLVVSNTLVADSGPNGIFVAVQGANNVTAMLSRVELYNNAFAGLNMSAFTGTGTLDATVTDSVAATNGGGGQGGGFVVQTAANNTQAVAFLTVIRSSAAYNTTNLVAFGPGAALIFGQSTLTGEGLWIAASGGVLYSFGDNYLVSHLRQVPVALPLLPKI